MNEELTREELEDPECPFRSCQVWCDDADGKCGGELHGGSAQETCKWYADYKSALNKYAEELTTELIQAIEAEPD